MGSLLKVEGWTVNRVLISSRYIFEFLIVLNGEHNRGVWVVEEFGVHSVDGFLRKNEWRQDIQLTPFVFTHTRCWIIISMELIVIVAKDNFNQEGSLSSVHKFCNFPSVWFWFYLDAGFNCISDFKFGSGSILVPPLYMRGPLLFG